MYKRIMDCKTIYLENDETKKTQKFTLLVCNLGRFIDLSSIITQVADWQEKYFQIYSPQQDQYISLDAICEQRLMIPREYLELNVVMIKYSDELDKSESEQSENNKKERSRQRTIREVIQLVRRWREMYNPPAQSKKLNLQEAAKIVGISKKSLDDYFFQLRMGEKHGFDFAKNMDNKVGLLRSFVKEKDVETKKNGKQKISRHPKKLRIIQQFADKLSLNQKSKSKEQIREVQQLKLDEDKKKLQEGFNLGKLVDTDQLFWGSPFSPIEQKVFLDCENNFFKDFQNLMQQPSDPFFPFADFKKSKSIFGDDVSFSSSLDF